MTPAERQPRGTTTPAERRRMAEQIEDDYRTRLRETIVGFEAAALEREREVTRLREALARILAEPSKAAAIAWSALHQ